MDTRYCKKNMRNEDIILLCDSISKCAYLIKRCDGLIKDHRGRRHTKIGKNAATLWEIAAVIKLRTGQDVRNATRKDYTSTIQPDNSIIVTEKKTGQQWHASNDEINNLEIRTFGSIEVPGIPGVGEVSKGLKTITNNLTHPQAYNSVAVNQNKHKLLGILSNVAAVVGTLASIIATLSTIKKDVGPAKETVTELTSSLKNALKSVGSAATKLKNKITK